MGSFCARLKYRFQSIFPRTALLGHSPLWPPHVHTTRHLMSGDVRVPTVGLVTNIDAHLRSLGPAGGQLVQDKRDAGLQLLQLRADPATPAPPKDIASSFVNPDKLAALVRIQSHTRPYKFCASLSWPPLHYLQSSDPLHPHWIQITSRKTNQHSSSLHQVR